MKHDFLHYLQKQDRLLAQKVNDAVLTFTQLKKDKKYYLSFSGGKDSHALLICFLLFKETKSNDTFDNVVVRFADTLLEEPGIYLAIDKIKETLPNIKFETVKAPKSYWYYQFVAGYPVPDWRIRWCTSELKTKPIKNGGGVSITGRHFGESDQRDRVLANTCTNGDCDASPKKSIEPLLSFTNCNIWDLIFYADGRLLYDGVFCLLKSLYNGNETENGSLRMGCTMCPVAGIGSVRNRRGYILREMLEGLRTAKRINSPQKGKKGSIYIEERRKAWKSFKPILLELGLLSVNEANEITVLLQQNAYPKTYPIEHIEKEHRRILEESDKQPIQLELFNWGV